MATSQPTVSDSTIDDVPQDDLVPINELQFPKKPQRATLWRWHINGVRGCKLKAIRIGSRLYSCDQWRDEFIAELNRSDAEKLQEEGC